MSRNLSAVLQGLVFVALSSRLLAQTEGLATVPQSPEAGSEFHVAILRDVAELQLGLKATGVKYRWEVTVMDGDRKVGLAAAGLTLPIPEAPSVKIKRARPESIYLFTLRRSVDDVVVKHQLVVDFGREGTEAKVGPPPPSVDPGSAAPTQPTAPVAPAPDAELRRGAAAPATPEAAPADTARLDYEPKPPKANEAFRVKLIGGGMATKYKWQVVVTKGETRVRDADTGIAALKQGVVETTTAQLEIKKALDNAVYSIKCTSDASPTDVGPLVLDFSTGHGQLVGESPQETNGDRDPPESDNREEEAQQTSKDWPTPPVLTAGIGRVEGQQRIRDARTWWEANAREKLPGKVNRDFIVARLTESRDGRFSLQKEIRRPLVAAARFYRAAYNATKDPTNEAKLRNPEDAKAAWKPARDELLTQLESIEQETARAARLSREFLDDLEAEIERTQAAEFSAALREAAMLVGALLLEDDRRQRERIQSGEGPEASGQDSGVTATSGSMGYGASHAAIHHARVMSRIRMRSARRLERYQRFQY
jgi:hypothetical protein